MLSRKREQFLEEGGSVSDADGFAQGGRCNGQRDLLACQSLCDVKRRRRQAIIAGL